MRLKGQLLVAACGSAVLFAAAGFALLQWRSSRRAVDLVDHQLGAGQSALVRLWSLRRGERNGAFLTVAALGPFSAALRSGLRAPVLGFAQAALRAGADDAVVTDSAGNAVATVGPHAGALAQALRAARVGGDGGLVALGGTLADVYKVPVGEGEGFAGYLVTARVVDQAMVRADAESLGVEAAVGAGGALVSTLPAELATELPGAGEPLPRTIGSGNARYRVRARPLAGGRLVVAAPLATVGALTSELASMVGLLLVMILLVVGGGAFIVVNRVTGPMAELERAAQRLGRGELDHAAKLLARHSARGDEIGALAEALAAAVAQLSTVVATSDGLSRNIARAVVMLDRSATSLGGGATRQEERATELERALGPIGQALDASAKGLVAAQELLREAGGDLGAVAREGGAALAASERVSELMSHDAGSGSSARLWTKLQIQLGPIRSHLREQQRHLGELRAQVEDVRGAVDGALDQQGYARHRRGVAERALAEIGRVAKSYGEEVAALRVSADALRQDIARLHDALGFLAGRRGD